MNSVRLLFSSAAFFFGLFIYSGTTTAQSIQFGLNGGLSMTSHIGQFHFQQEDINMELDPVIQLGYQAGIILRKNFSDSFRLQAEPSLVMLGARYEEPFTLRGFEFETDSRTELLYLQLPLLLQFSTSPPSQVVYGNPYPYTTFHFTGGVFGGYLLDAKFTGTNTGATVGVPFEGDFSNNITSQYSEYDGGAILGVGVERGSSSKIGFESRLIYSLVDSGNAPDLSFEPRNFAVTFSIYYLF
ncbi:outer membrane beta-barrel protein [Halalkalibaculum sp. DA3122]|uniref:outer membrane beta-barrel protein n=1 Tax=unclassified Halalkalibaculum TaxID=2964617 RepID=UPI0037544D04